MSKFEIYRDNSDEGEQCWRWRLKDSNGAKIARGGEPFVKSSIKRSIKTLKDKVDINTPVFLDESEDDTDTGYRFEYSKSENDSQWYWRLKAGNHEIMAIGGEGFSSEQSISKSIENVKLEIRMAKILFKDPKDDPAHKANSEDDTKENHSIPPGSQSLSSI